MAKGHVETVVLYDRSYVAGWLKCKFVTPLHGLSEDVFHSLLDEALKNYVVSTLDKSEPEDASLIIQSTELDEIPFDWEDD